MAKTNKTETETAKTETKTKTKKVELVGILVDSVDGSPYQVRNDGTNSFAVNADSGRSSEPIGSKRLAYAVVRRARKSSEQLEKEHGPKYDGPSGDDCLSADAVERIKADMKANAGAGRSGSNRSESLRKQLEKAMERRQKLADQLASVDTQIDELKPAVVEATEAEKRAAEERLAQLQAEQAELEAKLS